MTDLTVLRGSKQALEEGLITQQDYECVKVAFLKAQQIKAGLDAGFIRSEDYDKAVGSYMHALDFQLMTAVPSLSAPQPRAAPSVAAPASQAAYPTSYQQPSHPPPAPAAPPRQTSIMGAAAGMLFGRHSSSGAGNSGGGNSGGGNADWPAGGGSLSAQTSDQSQDLGPSINVDIPTDLPDYCKGATAGKVGSVTSRSQSAAER